mmetsp:Transcript_35493/g.68032  ORF Transcript_35493/g.68032 Transcript_35493/m.68032 type:complete len:474 (+) Transcript_35493:390-1811(+)
MFKSAFTTFPVGHVPCYPSIFRISPDGVECASSTRSNSNHNHGSRCRVQSVCFGCPYTSSSFAAAPAGYLVSIYRGLHSFNSDSIEGRISYARSSGMRTTYKPSLALQSNSKSSGIRGVGRRRGLVCLASASPALTAQKGGSRAWAGRAMLLVVAAAYGTLGVLFKSLYTLPGPPSASALSAARGWLTALCFLPVMCRAFARQQDQQGEAQPPRGEGGATLWRDALELAVYNAGIMGMLNVGLLHTTATRAAFLAQTSVCITPIIQMCLGDTVPWRTWLGSAVCLAGALVLMATATTSTGQLPAPGALAYGDFMCLGGALSFAFYCVRVGALAQKGVPAASLHACKNFLLALLYSGWVIVDTVKAAVAAEAVTSDWGNHLLALWPGRSSVTAWLLLAFSALVPGAMADFLQAKGQEKVSASEANIILSTDPLWAAFFSAFCLGERLTLGVCCGGALILSASLLSTLGNSQSNH